MVEDTQKNKRVVTTDERGLPGYHMALCLIVDDINNPQHILLAEKLSGKYKGYLLAPGGHLKYGDLNMFNCSRRKCQEEMGLKISSPNDMTHIGNIKSVRHDSLNEVRVYRVDRYTGHPKTNDSFGPAEWINIHQVISYSLPPHKKVLPDMEFWLRALLRNLFFNIRLEYNKDQTVSTDNFSIKFSELRMLNQKNQKSRS